MYLIYTTETIEDGRGWLRCAFTLLECTMYLVATDHAYKATLLLFRAVCYVNPVPALLWQEELENRNILAACFKNTRVGGHSSYCSRFLLQGTESCLWFSSLVFSFDADFVGQTQEGSCLEPVNKSCMQIISITDWEMFEFLDCRGETLEQL